MNRARSNSNNNLNGNVLGTQDMNNSNGNVLGTQGMNNSNGNTRQRSTALTGSLAEQIRALTFVKTELELYLDTHPNCRTALDYYRQTIEALERLTEEYHNQYGPLVASGNLSTDRWNWVNEPWPWHNGNMNGTARGRE